MAQFSFWDKFWRDKQGRDVIWQRPNVFLWIWLIANVFNWFISQNTIEKALSIISLAAIIVWAVLEIFSGVNYFRRLLGFVVLLVIIVSNFI